MNVSNILRMTVILFINIFEIELFEYDLFFLLILSLPHPILLIDFLIQYLNSSWFLYYHLEFEGRHQEYFRISHDYRNVLFHMLVKHILEYFIISEIFSHIFFVFCIFSLSIFLCILSYVIYKYLIYYVLGLQAVLFLIQFISSFCQSRACLNIQVENLMGFIYWGLCN